MERLFIFENMVIMNDWFSDNDLINQPAMACFISLYMIYCDLIGYMHLLPYSDGCHYTVHALARPKAPTRSP